MKRVIIIISIFIFLILLIPFSIFLIPGRFILFFTTPLLFCFLFFQDKINIKTWYKKVLVFALLLVFFPSVFVYDILGASFSKWNSGSVIGETMGITGLTTSFLDLFNTSNFFIPWGKTTLFVGLKEQNPYIIYQVYSIMFGGLFFILNFKNYFTLKIKEILSFYLIQKKVNVILFITSILAIFIILLPVNVIKEFSFSLLYLGLYFCLLFSFIFYRQKIKKQNIQNLFLLFLFTFPIIGVSDEYKQIRSDSSDDYSFERILSIMPLINAIPKTIFSFFIDSKKEHFDSFQQLKLYSLFQITRVLLLFPSILIAKEEKNDPVIDSSDLQ